MTKIKIKKKIINRKTRKKKNMSQLKKMKFVFQQKGKLKAI